MTLNSLELTLKWPIFEWLFYRFLVVVVAVVLLHPGSEIVRKFRSNMGQKSILNDIFNTFRTLGSVRNEFVFKFPRKWWYREVEGSFLSPFHGHFRFSWVRTISLPGCTTNHCSLTEKTYLPSHSEPFKANKNGHETDFFKSEWPINDMNLHNKKQGKFS